MSECDAIRLSVTQLAAFACRRGDLMPDSVVGPTAREGMRAHKMLQDERKLQVEKPDYLHAEMRVSCRCEVQTAVFELAGRIDLVNVQSGSLTEIKTTYVPAEHVPPAQQSVHWAQLYLYGFIYLQQLQAKQQNLPTPAHPADPSLSPVPEALNLELAYVNIREATQSSETRQVSATELADHAMQALQMYAQWLSQTEAWHDRMVASSCALTFPFEEFRQGQHAMAAAIYRSSRDAVPLLCEAPTGIGKTISSMFPAIKSLGEGTLQQLVYLTAKVAGRRSAEQAMQQLFDAGLQVTMIQIRAKQASCFCSNGRCERDDTGRCPMTLGFFDRLPAARSELLARGIIDNDTLDELAWQHQLCPFELVQQMLPWVQVVVADYNYVLDPLVRLAGFSSPARTTLLLIDEAHNLVDRGRAMYSARLDRLQCQHVASQCRQVQPLIARELDKLAKRLLRLASDSNTPYEVSVSPPAKLSATVSDVLGELSAAMAQSWVMDDAARELWLQLCRFAVISGLYSDKHRCVTETTFQANKRQVQVSLYCLDASDALAASYALYRSTVLFSATLRPGTFYRDTLGVGADARYLQLTSPFDSDNCLRCVVDWIDTRYHHRQQSSAALVGLIEHSTQLRPGNYLVFFPSYAYLSMVHELFVATYPERPTWIQARGQTKQEQQSLLDELDTPGHRVGFAIQGGVFGEGIDYTGERLVGTLIIGTGLPPPDWRTELIADQYRDCGHDGYEFAYRYPGFTRVLQTAGRVIRNESDKGFVLLVDARFRQPIYKKLFPEDWVVHYPKDENDLSSLIRRLWLRQAPIQEKGARLNSPGHTALD